MDSKIRIQLDKIQGWLSIHEGQFLYKAARIGKDRSGVIVEIGSYQGKSTIYLAKTGQHVYAIDPHEGKLDNGKKISPTLMSFQQNIEDFHVKNNVILLQKKSSTAVQNWKKEIKLLFIDGLHDEKNAKNDYKGWSSFLVDGGIVAMHDSFCGWSGAQSVALQNIVRNNMYSEVGVVGSIIYGVKGRKNFLTSLNVIRTRFFIQLAFWIHKQKNIPQSISFILIHKCIKFFLVNRFTLWRD